MALWGAGTAPDGSAARLGPRRLPRALSSSPHSGKAKRAGGAVPLLLQAVPTAALGAGLAVGTALGAAGGHGPGALLLGTAQRSPRAFLHAVSRLLAPSFHHSSSSPPLYIRMKTMHLANKEKALTLFYPAAFGCIQRSRG